MTNLSYESPLDARTLPFKDRRVSLRVVGVILLLLGTASGCFTILTPIGLIAGAMFQPPPAGTRGAPPAFAATLPTSGPSTAPAAASSTAPSTVPSTAPITTTVGGGGPPFAATPTTRLDWRTMVFAIAIYLIATVVFFSIGVGALRMRRWVRPLLLILGWTWLCSGVVGVGWWLLAAPSMAEFMATSTPPGAVPPPPAVTRAIAWSAGTVMTVLMVLLPGLIVWLASRKGVRETVEFFDPRVRWTDACPTPVLAVSAWLASAAVMSLMYTAYGILPLFGFIFSGIPAVLGLLAVTAAFAWLARQTYRLRLAGWWGALIINTLWSASMLWTFARMSYYEFYLRAGYTPQEADQILAYSGPYESASLWMIGLWAAVLIGFLLYVRKYFVGRRPADGPPQPFEGVPTQ